MGNDDDVKLWGISVKYVVPIAILIALYFFDAEFKSRSGNMDPKTVQILERLTIIELQLRNVENKLDAQSSDYGLRIQGLERWRYQIEDNGEPGQIRR